MPEGWKYRTIAEVLSLMGQGATRYKLSKKHLLKLELKLPFAEERQKIVAVLSTSDQEITSLQQKLDALMLEKKVMMQQLLTGKRRVQLTEQDSKATSYGS